MPAVENCSCSFLGHAGQGIDPKAVFLKMAAAWNKSLAIIPTAQFASSNIQVVILVVLLLSSPMHSMMRSNPMNAMTHVVF